MLGGITVLRYRGIKVSRFQGFSVLWCLPGLSQLRVDKKF